jgi:hypothetical protein
MYFYFQDTPPTAMQATLAVLAELKCSETVFHDPDQG